MLTCRRTVSEPTQPSCRSTASALPPQSGHAEFAPVPPPTIGGMRAIVFDQFSVRPQLHEVPAPAAPDAGVVIDVEATGVCRSDHHAWAGHDSTITLPHVPGHELVGRVASVGACVQDFRVGQRVTVPFVCGCGTCRWCVSGNAQVCPDQTRPGSRISGRGRIRSSSTMPTRTSWLCPRTKPCCGRARCGSPRPSGL